MKCVFFFSSRRRHTRCGRDWSSDVCSSDLHLQERLSLVQVPGAEPGEIITAITERRPGTYNVNGAGCVMDEDNAHLACDFVTDEKRDIGLSVPIKIATLIEGVHAIVPFIPILELSTERLESPRRHVPHSVDGEGIS